MVKDPNSLSITIKKTTSKRLEGYKHQGQSWDGILNELLDAVEKAHRNKTTKEQ